MPRSAASNRLVTRDMGKSGFFNGTNSYCTVPITPSTTALSFAMWLKLDKNIVNNSRILDWQDGGPLNGFTFIALNTSGRLSIQPRFQNGASVDGQPTAYEPNANDWVHTVVTYEPNNLKFYVNGTLWSQDTSISMSSASVVLTLAMRSGGGSRYTGLIDGFVFLNGRAMTATEVATLYTAGIHPSDTSCHIRFNDNVNDETSNANNLTAVNVTYSTDVPLKTRSAVTTPRRKVDNLVFNGDFEYAPAFTAATTTSQRWIDGTSGGSTTNNIYGWGTNLSGTTSVQFDSSEKKFGNNSLKISLLAAGSYAEVNKYGSNTTQFYKSYLIPALPSTSYTVTWWMKTNYVSGDTSQGATVGLIEFNGAFSATTFNSGSGATIKTTNDWTQYSFTVTTQSTTRFLNVQPRIYGHQGTATLIMDAWFDDISIVKTTPDTRTTA